MQVFFTCSLTEDAKNIVLFSSKNVTSDTSNHRLGQRMEILEQRIGGQTADLEVSIHIEQRIGGQTADLRSVYI